MSFGTVRIKTKVQAFGDILDATNESTHVNGENVEVMQMFTYLGCVIHSSTSCELEVNPRLGRAWSAMNLVDEGVERCRYFCKRTNVQVSRSLVLPVFQYSCQTWTLSGELGRGLNSFVSMSLRRILGYRWHDYMSNNRVVGLSQVTCIVTGVVER